MQLPISITSSTEKPKPSRAVLDYPEGFNEFRVLEDKESTPLWSPALYPEGTLTSKNHLVAEVSALVLDLDNPAEVYNQLAAFSSYNYVFISSHSYRDHAPKGRLILPLDTPCTPNQHRKLWRWAEALLGHTIDANCKDPSRRYFIPCHPPEVAPVYYHNEGSILTLEAAGIFTIPDSELLDRYQEGTWAVDLEGAEGTEDLAAIEGVCPFMRHAREQAATLSEPAWRAALSVWIRTTEGTSAAHQHSAEHPGYSATATNEKIKGLSGKSAYSCETISTLWKGCQGCRLKNLKLSPAAFGRPANQEQAQAYDANKSQVGLTMATERLQRLLKIEALAKQQLQIAKSAARAQVDPIAASQVAQPAEDILKQCQLDLKEAKSQVAKLRQAEKGLIERVKAEATGIRTFIRGDHVELAATLVKDLTCQDQPPLWSAGIWAYSQEGVYYPVQKHDAAFRIQGYAGTLIYPLQGSSKVLAVSNTDIAGAFAVADHLVRVASPPEPFLRAQPVACFQNGLYEAATGSFGPYEPEDRIQSTRLLPVPYEPSVAPASWLSFLDQVFEPDPDRVEKVACIRMFLGACILGIATRYAKYLILKGEGSNGKSVFMQVIGALFPSATAITPQDLGGSKGEYYKATLANSPINLVSELPESDILDSAPFKAAVAGDKMQARSPAGNPFEFKPVAGWILAANQLPPVRDTTYGFWRRTRIIEFNRVFQEHEQNPFLDKELIAELPAIATWAVAGGLQLLKAGRYPALGSSNEAADTWRMESDPVLAFINEVVEPAEGKHTPANKLYSIYQGWCRDQGRQAVSATRLGRRLKAAGVEAKRLSTGNVYLCDIRKI